MSLMNAQQSFLDINFFLFQSIISILKRHFGKHNYSAIQQVFPILKEFNAIQPDFYVTLQVRWYLFQCTVDVVLVCFPVEIK